MTKAAPNPSMPNQTASRGYGKSIILLSTFNFLLWASLGVLAPIEVLFLDSIVRQAYVKGLLISIPSFVLLIFSPYAARLSDAYGRKKIILGLVFVASPFFVLLPLSNSYKMYGAIKIVSSFLFLTSPILLAYVSDTRKRLGVGFGSVILASSLGGGFGALASGLIGEAFGLTVPYYMITMMALLSVLFVLPLQGVRVRAKPKPTQVRKMDIFVVAVLANTLIFFLHFSARSVVWPLVLEEISNAPAMLAGVIFSLMGLTAAILSVPTGLFSERFGERRIFFLGWSIMGIVGVLLFFATKSVYMFLVLSILFAVGEILKGPSGSMILAKQRRSVYFGYLSSIGSLGGLIGAIAAGFFVDSFGVQASVLILGLLVLLPLIPFFFTYFAKRQK